MTIRTWTPDEEKRVDRSVTPAQGRFLDMIEELGFCEFHNLVVMNGNPITWTKLIQKGRFDIKLGNS